MIEFREEDIKYIAYNLQITLVTFTSTPQYLRLYQILLHICKV